MRLHSLRKDLRSICAEVIMLPLFSFVHVFFRSTEHLLLIALHSLVQPLHFFCRSYDLTTEHQCICHTSVDTDSRKRCHDVRSISNQRDSRTMRPREAHRKLVQWTRGKLVFTFEHDAPQVFADVREVPLNVLLPRGVPVSPVYAAHFEENLPAPLDMRMCVDPRRLVAAPSRRVLHRS